MSPFLNVLIHHLNKNAFIILLTIMACMVSIPVTFFPGARPYMDESHLFLCMDHKKNLRCEDFERSNVISFIGRRGTGKTSALGEYANQFFYEKDAATAPATSIGESVLSGVQQALYEEMKTKVTNIAAKGGSTKFKITSDLGLRWQTSASGARLEKEVSQTFDNLDTDKVLSCLRTDCPYELYWYEKTANTEWSYNYSVSVSGGKRIVRITDLEVSMPVCNGYASDQYRVDASMVNIAKASAANAKQIVNEFKNSSVTEKLVAYKEMICYLTDYNDEAMSDSYADGYGDPWQLIWVFDGDESTQVVCEGYSKAFQ